MKLKDILKEANPDGTISPDEDKLMDELMTHIEQTMEELLYEAEQETARIGGRFRQPGMKDQVIKLITKMVNDFDKGVGY